MEKVQEIIVPVDFHSHTQEVLKFAMDIANRLDANLTIVHALEYIIPYTDYSPESSKIFDDKLRVHAENKMENLVEECKTTFPECTGVILRGEVIESLVNYAKESKADLIVMGTHGAKGIEKILLGSVAERVLKRAPCPVLMFNPFQGKIA